MTSLERTQTNRRADEAVSGVESLRRPGPEGEHEPVLVAADVRTTFDTPTARVRAVNGVSLTLNRGRTLGVVGESGSGKSVLARSLMGIPMGPTATVTGSVRFRDFEVVGADIAELRKRWGADVAMVMQDPMTALNPVLRVDRQITEHLRHHRGVSRAAARQAALELMAQVQIPDPRQRMRSYPHELSGGMRQRLCVAIALACGPLLLIADEPTTALDVTVQHEILNLLGWEQRHRNMSMMLVTHDLSVVAGRTDEVVVMYAGRVVEQAPTDVLFRNARMPYTEALLGSIPRMSDAKHSRLRSIPGRPPDLTAPISGCAFAPRCAYAQDRCRHEEPPLVPGADPGHLYRCWYPIGAEPATQALTSVSAPTATGHR